MKTVYLTIALLIFSGLAVAEDFDAVKGKLDAALAADSRPEADAERDRNRRPGGTLEFFGLRDNMKVIELLPGGGWYTRLLAPIMAENGEFYVAYGTDRVAENLAGQPGFENIQVIAEDSNLFRPEGSRFYELENPALGVTDVDIVFTFRNYHSFAAAGRAAMNAAVYDALKPGGIYAVVDHSRRHMEGENNENRRRVDPVLAIKEIEAAGFEFVDYSDLHYRPDDELRYEVGRASVTGNTDRFTFKFRKK